MNGFAIACTAIATACSIVASVLALLAWRRTRRGDWMHQIETGDKTVRDHAQRGLDALSMQLAEVSNELGAVRRSVVRMEQEQIHHLTAESLGPLHDKINQVANAVAAGRAETRALFGQIKLIQNHLLK